MYHKVLTLSIMEPFRDITQYEPGDRLFYELGFKINAKLPNHKDNWIRTGQFKEILDVQSLILMDNMLSDPLYLEHHNFKIIKGNVQT